jgi:hypothetical protein
MSLEHAATMTQTDFSSSNTRIIVELANIGGTAATVKDQTVRFRDIDSKEHSLKLGEHSHTLGAQQVSFGMFEIHVPLSKKLPNPFIMHFGLTYLDINGDSHRRRIFSNMRDADGRCTTTNPLEPED